MSCTGSEVMYCLVKGTDKLPIQNIHLVCRFWIADAIFLQWVYARAIAFHILDVSKELFVAGAWFAHRIVDVVIMGTSTCLLDFFLDFFVTNPASLFLGRSLLVCPLPEVDFFSSLVHWSSSIMYSCAVSARFEKSSKCKSEMWYYEMKLKVGLKQRFET